MLQEDVYTTAYFDSTATLIKENIAGHSHKGDRDPSFSYYIAEKNSLINLCYQIEEKPGENSIYYEAIDLTGSGKSKEPTTKLSIDNLHPQFINENARSTKTIKKVLGESYKALNYKEPFTGRKINQ